MKKCPEYIKTLYDAFDKHTYLIQAHSKTPNINSYPHRLDDKPPKKISGINDVFFNLPNDVYVVYGTPNFCSLFDVPGVDDNIKSQLKNNGNKLLLSQNPDNYAEDETYREYLDNMGIYCPGDLFYDFAITFEDDPGSFNISMIKQKKIIRAYNRDHSVGLGRKLKNIVKTSIPCVRYFKLSHILDLIKEFAENNVVIVYLLSCNLGPSQTDERAAYDKRGAYIREYDALSNNVLDKGISNIEYLREHADFVSTRGRRKAVVSSDIDPFETDETLPAYDVAQIEGKFIRKQFKDAVNKVIYEYPFGWSDKGCPCIDVCKKKKNYGTLSRFSGDSDKYFCEVDTTCVDESQPNDGGKRYHKTAKKLLAKCPEKV